MILFENLFKPGQLHLEQCFELTSSVLSTTSKQCFEQPVTSFLIDALVLIAYNQKEKFSPEKHIE
ncbi:S1 RNA-binding domain-containing protein [Streptococcus pneumoniae]|nr:S1 RNA-binding domain-containing protein [Streptococcus pneumoniae]CJD29773.1 S1 RNA-binding domain-containing protein [Streptococcus pneumoniae]